MKRDITIILVLYAAMMILCMICAVAYSRAVEAPQPESEPVVNTAVVENMEVI